MSFDIANAYAFAQTILTWFSKQYTNNLTTLNRQKAISDFVCGDTKLHIYMNLAVFLDGKHGPIQRVYLQNPTISAKSENFVCNLRPLGILHDFIQNTSI